MRASRPLPLLLIALVLLLAAADAQARELVDKLGRRVLVPENPFRVVALAPSVTEIVFALGEQRRLVGVSTHSDYPEEAKRLSVVGSYVRPDLERILALKPDLCLAVRDGNPKAIADRLEAMGIPVYAVDPQTLGGILQAVEGVGEVLGATERARDIVDRMREGIEGARALAAKARSRPRVFYQIGVAPMVSAGSGTYLHEMIELAGGENLAAGREPYPRFSPEEVVTMAPEVILVSVMRSEGTRAHEIWGRFSTVPALRSGRVHVVDSDLFDRPSPRLVQALEELVLLLHPELSGEGARQ
jgi:iron complex transport system substrate-binding protein